ncbi:hypothetical protein ACOZ4I_18350 (plasmid) [Haloarcula salina]|uniref:hypothetical protein n=1 Tax=Haloarcula salina TaxID=1429914 RepID=UPI003C6EB9D3
MGLEPYPLLEGQYKEIENATHGWVDNTFEPGGGFGSAESSYLRNGIEGCEFNPRAEYPIASWNVADGETCTYGKLGDGNYAFADATAGPILSAVHAHSGVEARLKYISMETKGDPEPVFRIKGEYSASAIALGLASAGFNISLYIYDEDAEKEVARRVIADSNIRGPYEDDLAEDEFIVEMRLDYDKKLTPDHTYSVGIEARASGSGGALDFATVSIRDTGKHNGFAKWTKLEILWENGRILPY